MPELFETHFEIEKQCGLSCRHCSSLNIRPCAARGYSKDDIHNMLSLLRQYNLEVSLTGGEPLLCHDLEDIVYAIASSKLTVKIGLFTTGLLTVNGAIFALPVNTARTLKQKGVAFCYISIYSADEQIHDKMTQRKGSFALTQEAIKRLLNAGIDVRFNTVIYSENENHLNQIIDYAKEIGSSEVRLLKLVNHGNARNNWDALSTRLTDLDYKNIINGLKQRYSNSISITVSSMPGIVPCRPSKNSSRCQAGSRLLYVAFDGFVYPCACTKNRSNCKICHISEVDKLKNYIQTAKNNIRYHCLGEIEDIEY